MTTPTHRHWFDADDSNYVSVAVITDDLHVEINALGTVTIAGWEGAAVQLDFDDTADVAAALLEAVRILRERGHRSAYVTRGPSRPARTGRGIASNSPAE